MLTDKEKKPEGLPCVQCGTPGKVNWSKKSNRKQQPCWVRLRLCSICQWIKSKHGLTRVEYDALMAQGCSMPGCDQPAAHLDHDHSICPKPSHSCAACRRGPLCRYHNVYVLPFIEAFLKGEHQEVLSYLAKYGSSDLTHRL